MCGISGILSLNNQPIKFLDDRIELMTKSLGHRGPDQEGIYISKDKCFALSSNRLSIVAAKEIIDLPYTKNNNEFLSFNGEIYNYIDLKKNLEKEGVKFSTNSDQEVLYEYLNKYNFKDLEKINGIWALAFYNQRKNQLLLSRDLMGERHLFYTVSNNELIFSSEVKAILSVLLKKSEFDFNSIISSWKFNSCQPGKTLIKDIYRLKAGYNLICSNNKIETIQFQKLHPEKWFDFFQKLPKEEEVSKKFETLLYNEAKIKIPREVKYYTALSGGIDSTLLVNNLSKIDKNINTLFHVSSKTQVVDDERSGSFAEISLSKKLAKKFKTNHSFLHSKESEILEELKSSAKDCFEGCSCFASANYSLIARYLKKNNAKVFNLSEGPDELLGGYISDIEANKLDKLFSKNNILKYVKKYPFLKFVLSKLFRLKKNKEFEFKYNPFYARVTHFMCTEEFLNKIIKNYNYDQEKVYDYGLLDKAYNDIESHLDYSQKRALIYATKSLPDMFNFRADKSMMKYSIEVRQHFLSVEMVEFLIAMPEKYRFDKHHKFGKKFLREYCKNNVDEVVGSAPKRGIGYNLFLEIKNNGFEKEINEIITDTDFFSKYPFAKNIKKILLDKKTHPLNRWSAYCFIKTYENMRKIEKYAN